MVRDMVYGIEREEWERLMDAIERVRMANGQGARRELLEACAAACRAMDVVRKRQIEEETRIDEET